MQWKRTGKSYLRALYIYFEGYTVSYNNRPTSAHLIRRVTEDNLLRVVNFLVMPRPPPNVLLSYVQLLKLVGLYGRWPTHIVIAMVTTVLFTGVGEPWKINLH